MTDGRQETVGDRLMIAMKKAGMTNQVLAKKLGVAVGTVSNWRSDRFPPDQARIPEIAHLLGVEPGWLLYGGENWRRRERDARDAELGAYAVRSGVTRYRTLRERARDPGGMPRDLQILGQEFEIEALRAGATEDDMEYIHHALRSPEAAQMFAGGYNHPLTADEMQLEMESLIEMLRSWLKGRMQRRKGR